MKCKYNEEELMLYYYDELDSSVKDEMRNHLEGCSECSQVLQKLKTALDRIKLQGPEMTQTKWDNYRVRVHEKIEERAGQGKLLFIKPRIAQTTAAAMLFLAVIFGGLKYYDAKQSGTFIIENYELMMDLELIEDLEILENLEEIEKA